MFSRRTTTVVTVIVVALVTVALVASALPVFAHPAAALPAHAQLVSTTPEDGTSVDTVDEVSLTFSEDVDERFLELAVEGPDGAEADGDPTADGGKVTQAVVADLPAGEHTVTYRVVSVDGHPVSGTFAFTTTEAPASATPTPSDSPSSSAGPTTSAGSPTPTPAPSSTPTAATEGTSWTLPALLVGLVLVVGLAALALSRRRPGGGPEDPDGSA